MPKRKASQEWKLIARGALVGWLLGMFWLMGIVIREAVELGWCFGVLPSMMGVPVAALLWAAVGCMVGAVTCAMRGPWVPVGASVGAFGGAFYTLTTGDTHDWALGFLYCPGGAVVGTAVGLAWRQLSGEAPRRAVPQERGALTAERSHAAGAGMVLQAPGSRGGPEWSGGIQVGKPLPPWERPGCFRRDCAPHRGNLLFGSAVLGLTFCTVSPQLYGLPLLAAFPLSLAAWILGRGDLALMQKGLMDPHGETRTRQARGLGLGLGAFLCCCLVGILTLDWFLLSWLERP